jgi:SAM-dependent methyltransferase
MTSSLLHWPVPDALLQDPMIDCARGLARKYKDSSPDEILNIYVQYADKAEVELEFRPLFDLLRPLRFSGQGLELGAGVAIFSASLVRQFPEIQKIYAVEAVPEVVEWLQPKVVRHIAPESAERVQPVLGSFDDLQLSDCALDFAIELGSLHHSHDLDRTLRELARVVRKGGVVVALDRAHNDRLSDEQREFMLNVRYSPQWLEANGFPPQPLTRRQNGEHEHRLGEWLSAFERAGFALERRLELRPIGFDRFLRSCRLALPFWLRKRLNWLPSRPMEHPGECWWRLKLLLGLKGQGSIFHTAIRDKTVFVLRRI